MGYPKRVVIREDGPREGFQLHPRVVPTEQKLELIEMLAGTGVSSIEVTSFVRSDLVPQLADAEDLAGRLRKREGVRFTALYLNQRGLMRAVNTPALSNEGLILVAASEEFLKRNNRESFETALAKLPEWKQCFDRYQLEFERLIVSTAFGDSHVGLLSSEYVLGIIKTTLDRCSEVGLSPREITLADTTGYGNPRSVAALISATRKHFPGHKIGLHLHDTRGLGVANVLVGLELGVDLFDCSVGGMGGCPNVPHAAGNVATEDVVYLCESLGIETGIDLNGYIKCAQFAEQLLGTSLPGKVKNGGAPRRR